MLCFGYRRLLIPFSEGALDEGTRAKVARHVERCGACRAELACINSVAGALRETDIASTEPSHDLWIKVRGRIETVNASRSPGLVSRVPQTVYAFAAVLVLGLIGWSTLRVRTIPEEVQMVQSPTPVLRSAPSSKSTAQSTASHRPPGAADSKPARMDAAVSARTPERIARLPQAAASAESAGAAIEPTEETAAAPVPGEKPTVTGSVTSAGTALEETRSSECTALADRDRLASKGTSSSPTDGPMALGRARYSAGACGALLAPSSDKKHKDSSLGDRSAAYLAKTARVSFEEYVEIAKKQMAAGQKTAATTNFIEAFEAADTESWPVILQRVAEAGAVNLVQERAARLFAVTNSIKTGEILYALQSSQNHFRGMVATAEKLVMYNPNQPKLWLKLGEAYEAAGDKKKALDAYERAASGSDKTVAVAAKAKAEALRKALHSSSKDQR